MPCAVCRCIIKEDAHVKPRHTFTPQQDDRSWNIIPLCPTHHEWFDEGNIGILPDKRHFLIDNGIGELQIIDSKVNIENIRDEYVEERNQLCNFNIRLRLGMIPGAQYASWIDGAS